eukprot:TRINITY_DN2983_c0_g3_i1.p1 TRINITY_DN2983_c0_g3~~TRINITY_DN2983_c0_g3_i1.p1  ORF type:complete len:743 (+),score=193.49 TRINITY_DN2983_c0_g3_i1:84-2312(+)
MPGKRKGKEKRPLFPKQPEQQQQQQQPQAAPGGSLGAGAQPAAARPTAGRCGRALRALRDLCVAPACWIVMLVSAVRGRKRAPAPAALQQRGGTAAGPKGTEGAAAPAAAAAAAAAGEPPAAGSPAASPRLGDELRGAAASPALGAQPPRAASPAAPPIQVPSPAASPRQGAAGSPTAAGQVTPPRFWSPAVSPSQVSQRHADFHSAAASPAREVPLSLSPAATPSRGVVPDIFRSPAATPRPACPSLGTAEEGSPRAAAIGAPSPAAAPLQAAAGSPAASPRQGAAGSPAASPRQAAAASPAASAKRSVSGSATAPAEARSPADASPQSSPKRKREPDGAQDPVVPDAELSPRSRSRSAAGASPQVVPGLSPGSSPRVSPPPGSPPHGSPHRSPRLSPPAAPQVRGAAAAAAPPPGPDWEALVSGLHRENSALESELEKIRNTTIPELQATYSNQLEQLQRDNAALREQLDAARRGSSSDGGASDGGGSAGTQPQAEAGRMWQDVEDSADLAPLLCSLREKLLQMNLCDWTALQAGLAEHGEVFQKIYNGGPTWSPCLSSLEVRRVPLDVAESEALLCFSRTKLCKADAAAAAAELAVLAARGLGQYTEALPTGPGPLAGDQQRRALRLLLQAVEHLQRARGDCETLLASAEVCRRNADPAVIRERWVQLCSPVGWVKQRELEYHGDGLAFTKQQTVVHAAHPEPGGVLGALVVRLPPRTEVHVAFSHVSFFEHFCGAKQP